MEIISDERWQDFLDSLSDLDTYIQDDSFSQGDYPYQLNFEEINGIAYPENLLCALKLKEFNFPNNVVYYFKLDHIVGGENKNYELTLLEISEQTFLSIKPYCFNFLLVSKNYDWVVHFRPDNIISVYGPKSLIDHLRNLDNIRIIE